MVNGGGGGDEGGHAWQREGMHCRGCVAKVGVHGKGGCVWQRGDVVCGKGVCVARGACTVNGVCVAGGHAWQGGMHGGGMHGRGHVWQGGGGTCMLPLFTFSVLYPE